MGHVVNGQVYVFAYPDPTAKRDRPGPIRDPGRQSWPYTQLGPAEITRVVGEVKATKIKGDPNPYRDPDGPWYIIPYDGLNDLIKGISIILRDETWGTGTSVGSIVIHHNPCLTALDIWSHGNPDRCGGITEDTFAAFAQELDKLNLCDNLDIWFDGCDTGNRNWNEDGSATPSPLPCISEQMAEVWKNGRRR